MPIPPGDLAEILGVISQRFGGARLCPVCEKANLSLNDAGFVTVQVVDRPLQFFAGRGYPCVSMVCVNCGNTVLLNLYNLGLSALVERLREPIPATEPPTDG